MQHVGSRFPDQRLNPTPPAFAAWVLTIGSPGKSQHHFFKLHLCCSMYQCFISFYGWIIFHCMDLSYLIISSFVDGDLFPLFFLCIFLCSSASFSTLFSVCIFYKHRTLSLSHNDRLFQWENSVQYYDRYSSYDRFALQLLAVYSLFMLLSSSESSHCFPWGWILLCVLLNGSLSQLS